MQSAEFNAHAVRVVQMSLCIGRLLTVLSLCHRYARYDEIPSVQPLTDDSQRARRQPYSSHAYTSLTLKLLNCTVSHPASL